MSHETGQEHRNVGLVPKEYEGREQSWLKHRVLAEYLERWGHKIASLETKMWFVDCFSGPWKSKDQHLRDTSIDIGLRALRTAQETWRRAGRSCRLGAVFVEKDPSAFTELTDYIEKNHSDSTVDIHPIHGQFGEHSPAIAKLLGADPAFVFVDPTGFKGAAMDFIQPLVQPRMRDVLVNVMFEYANRFPTELREHLQPFFRVEDHELVGLSEEDLLELYRGSLKKHCGLSFAADLRVPHPTQERTWFRLVVGGKDKAVLDVFRDVEERVMGREAGHARDGARRAAQAARTGTLQMGLFAPGGDGGEPVPMPDDGYAAQHASDLKTVRERLLHIVQDGRRRAWRDLWPALLEQHHVTLRELSELGAELKKHDLLAVEPWAPKRRRLQDGDVVSAGRALDRDLGK